MSMVIIIMMCELTIDDLEFPVSYRRDEIVYRGIKIGTLFDEGIMWVIWDCNCLKDADVFSKLPVYFPLRDASPAEANDYFCLDNEDNEDEKYTENDNVKTIKVEMYYRLMFFETFKFNDFDGEELIDG